MWALIDKASYVTKQILKEAAENVLPVVALGKPELTHSLAGSDEGHPRRPGKGNHARTVLSGKIFFKRP